MELSEAALTFGCMSTHPLSFFPLNSLARHEIGVNIDLIFDFGLRIWGYGIEAACMGRMLPAWG